MNDSGNVPDSRVKIIIVVMGFIKISNKALIMFVGIGSRSHDFDADFIMIFLTSSSDPGSKLKSLLLILQISRFYKYYAKELFFSFDPYFYSVLVSI